MNDPRNVKPGGDGHARAGWQHHDRPARPRRLVPVPWLRVLGTTLASEAYRFHNNGGDCGDGAGNLWAGATAGGGVNDAVVVFAVVMAAWIGLVGAVLKDLADAPGDAVAGRRTFAVVYGVAPVRRYAAVCALAVALAGLAASLWWAPSMLPTMLVLVGGALWVAVRCRSVGAQEQPKANLRPYFASFWVQYGLRRPLSRQGS